MPPSMRAAVLHTPGSPPSYGEHPAPAPASGSTLVRVTAAPVVPLDLLCASGTSYFGVPATPYVPGGQGVGDRRGVGTRTPAGSRVWFFATAGMKPGDGSMAELCLVPDHDVVPIADEVPDELAAALGLSGVAAWMALSWRARLQHGEKVLVLGGGGAVGQAGIGAARVARRVDRRGRRPAGVDRPCVEPPGPTSSYRSTATSTPSPRRWRSTDRSTSCSTPSSASRRPRPRGSWRQAAAWSTSAVRRATRRPSPRPGCAAAPRRCSATPTTRSAPSSGPRQSGPCSPMPPRVGSGCSTTSTRSPRSRTCGDGEMAGRSGARCVLLPESPC